MGFWGTLGRTALRVAPYAAAPFTGGASLAAAPMANRMADNWAQSSANNEARRTGLAPSQSAFERFSSMGANAAQMAGGMGAFGRGNYGAQNFGGDGDGYSIGPSGGGGQYRTPDFNPYARQNPNQGGGIMGGIMARIPELMSRGTGGGIQERQEGGGRRAPQPSQSPAMGSRGYNPYDVSPNLGYAIEAGRSDAMRNQPWRQAPIATDPALQLPNIYPQYDPAQQNMGIGPRRAMPRY